jgi:hypothetical protein
MPSPRDELELVRIVAAAIEKHARGDVEKLADRHKEKPRPSLTGAPW